MKDPRTNEEIQAADELDAARETIESALAHLRLPNGRKRARKILEEGLKRHGHSTGYRLRHAPKQ